MSVTSTGPDVNYTKATRSFALKGSQAETEAINVAIPSQSGSTGKYLQTDGTVMSWNTPAGGGGGGGGDASTNTAISVANEVALYADTTGKLLKRSTGTGLALLTSGVQSTVTAPAGTVLGTTDTQTLTNKRITKRIENLTDAATVTPATDTNDGGKLTSLSQTTTIANPTGTPTPFQQYLLRIKSTASQSLSWGSQFRGSTAKALPTATTGSSLTDYYGFQWNSDDTKWDFIADRTGF